MFTPLSSELYSIIVNGLENMPPETNEKVITYNPYKYDSFVRKDSEEPIYNANEIDMINTKNKIFHINEIVG